MFTDIDQNLSYTCGNLDFSFSGMIPYVVSTIILVLKIAVPVLLVIFGSIDFLKAVTASKEDEIKKGQQTFIKRLIDAVLVFFIIQIVQLILNFAANDDGISGCFNCFVNGKSCEAVTTTTNNNGGV